VSAPAVAVPDPEAAYYQSVEEFFVSRRGDPLFLSNADWLLIRKWRQAGTPLRIVLRGIADALDAHAHSFSRDRKVGSLAYCAAEVEVARERWQRALASTARRAPACRTRWPDSRMRSTGRQAWALRVQPPRDGWRASYASAPPNPRIRPRSRRGWLPRRRRSSMRSRRMPRRAPWPPPRRRSTRSWLATASACRRASWPRSDGTRSRAGCWNPTACRG
jgi:hypothetical protein